MYYQPNQYQNPKPNYVQNYNVPITQNPAKVANPNQYQYPTYTVPQNQYITQPQNQKVHPVQNVQQVQNYQNYPIAQQPHQHHHNNVQKQNLQYVQAPAQTPNTYVQYGQPVQQANGLQPQTVPLQGQNLKQRLTAQPKHNYNIKTNVVEGKLPPKTVMLNQNNTPAIQDPNLVKNVQVTNQMAQPQGQKMVFKAPNPKPIAASHNQSITAPTLPPPNTQTKADFKEHSHNSKINNIVNTAINQPTPPTTEVQKKDDPKFQMEQAQKDKRAKKTASFMTVNSLAGLPYKNYPQVEFSTKPFLNISGYGSNSYNGKIKNYNEDKIKIQYKVSKNYFAADGKEYQAFISYFGVFDGHGGENCSKFLKKNLDTILFQQTMFPHNVVESVRETFSTAERSFKQFAVQNGKLVDKSGSCACIALIINNVLYAINLGDSRALYSKDGGKEYYQITRDHKPNDPKERTRIEKAGGKVYYANKTYVNGVEVTLKEEQFGPGFTFPYRLAPSGLAVSFYLIYYFLLNF
jgi:hypothetical protein